MDMFQGCFNAFFSALCAALVLVPFLRRWALDRNLVDAPDQRKLHETAVPRLGGIAIFLAFLFAALIFTPVGGPFRGLVAGALVIFAIGIADDLNGLSARAKVIGQVFAILVTILVGKLWLHNLGDLFGNGPLLLPPWLGIPFTVLAVIGVTNAINLIDGLDGLAGGLSLLALVAFTLLAASDGNAAAAMLCAALAGGVLGFLKYNFYPARVFMGDAGSLTVGFLIAFLAVMITQRPGSVVEPMLPVLILALPIFDTLWVMGRRLLCGRAVFAPDRSHLHHQLLQLGFQHRFTVLLIHALSLFWASSALLLRAAPGYLQIGYLCGASLCIYLLLRHLSANPGRYAFLHRDGGGPLRGTLLFSRWADRVNRLVPLLAAVLLCYAFAGIGEALREAAVGVTIPAGLAVIGIGLRRFGGRDDFLPLLAYATACLLAYTLWHHCPQDTLPGYPFGLLDLSLIAGVALVALKLLFRRPGEFFLGSADFLALVLMIFLLVLAEQPRFEVFGFHCVLQRAIPLVLVIRVLTARSAAACRRTSDAAIVTLVLLALAGLK